MKFGAEIYSEIEVGVVIEAYALFEIEVQHGIEIEIWGVQLRLKFLFGVEIDIEVAVAIGG